MNVGNTKQCLTGGIRRIPSTSSERPQLNLLSGNEFKNGVVVNVDLKMNSYLAVISTGAFLGNADYLSHKQDEDGYEYRRGNV
jgi:hypothetical protein